MKLTFLGATHEVTGSCTLIEAGGVYGIVDCGMEQGEDRFQNQSLPVDAGRIEFVLLTHAHIDHSGNLPLLYKNGCKAPIYATSATCHLCQVMLRDCANIQASDAQWQTRKAQRAGLPPVEPIYTMEDAEAAIRCLRPCEYEQTLRISEQVEIRFTDAGHLLGSASIQVWLTEGEARRKLVFSGDIGNLDQPIINNPHYIEKADFVITESTYGDRNHQALPGGSVEYLAQCIQRTFDRGGNVVIPSFAVGRTQELLYFLREIKQRGLVTGHEHFPVYVDSPLANEATAVFLQCERSCFDPETQALLDQGVNPLVFDGLRISVTSDESKAINEDKTPKVILSASGMCEAGRIRHHLKHNLWRPESMILFVGYQAVGTTGRAIRDGAKSVRLFGETVSIRAEITYLPGKSGHADKAGLLTWIQHFNPRPEQVFVNHGDDAVCQDYVRCLEELGYQACAPYSGTVYDLAAGAFTEVTAGVPVLAAPEAHTRANRIYDALLAAGQRLLTALQGCRGLPNKELSRLTGQITALCEKIENGQKPQ